MTLKETMTSRERVMAALAGEPVDRPPVANPTNVMTVELMDMVDAPFPDANRDPVMNARLAETGYTELDAITGGLHESELIVLAARPSMGKTALAMNIAEHAALVVGAPTLFVSLEMAAVELADRLLCSVARVNGHRLRNGTISNADSGTEIIHTLEYTTATARAAR